MPILDTTLAPLFREPPHMVHDDGVAIWFVSPLGMVIQVRAIPRHFSGDAGAWIVGTAYARLLRVRGKDTTGVHVLHDYSNVESYDPRARVALTEWGLRIRKEVRQIYMAPPAGFPVIRAAVSMGASVMTLAGIPTEVVSDLRVPLRERNYRVIASPAP